MSAKIVYVVIFLLSTLSVHRASYMTTDGNTCSDPFIFHNSSIDTCLTYESPNGLPWCSMAKNFDTNPILKYCKRPGFPAFNIDTGLPDVGDCSLPNYLCPEDHRGAYCTTTTGVQGLCIKPVPVVLASSRNIALCTFPFTNNTGGIFYQCNEHDSCYFNDTDEWAFCGNVALGKTPDQSSTNSDLGALLGLDGDNCSDSSLVASGCNGHCFQTISEMNPWWSVDLGSVYSVSSVAVANLLATDGVISITVGWFKSVTGLTVNGFTTCGAQSVGSQQPISYIQSCGNQTLLGKYVVVQVISDSVQQLTVCEVQVTGRFIGKPVSLVNQDPINAASTNRLSDTPGLPSLNTSVILFPFRDSLISGRLEGLVIRNLNRIRYSPLSQAYFQWWIADYSNYNYYQLIWSTQLPALTSSYVYKNVSRSNINPYNGNMFGIYFPNLDFNFLSNHNDISDLVNVKVLNFQTVPNKSNSWPYPPAVEFLDVAISASVLVEYLEVIILPLACNSLPCLNRGVCNESPYGYPENDFTCTCPGGYTGKFCEIGFGDCQSFPCQLQGACTPLPASELSPYNLTYTCSCILGVTGHICETNIDECASNPCTTLYNANCVDYINYYQCICLSERTDPKCSTVACPDGWHFLEDNCYFFPDVMAIDTPISIDTATQFCAGNGGTLIQNTTFTQTESDLMAPLMYNAQWADQSLRVTANECGFSTSVGSVWDFQNCSWPNNYVCKMVADTNQCSNNPCQFTDATGATITAGCEDGYKSYTCTCPGDRTGVSCETVACAPNWNFHGNFCYAITPTASTWFHAVNSSCPNMQPNSSISSITTIEQQIFVSKLMLSVKETKAWIGLFLYINYSPTSSQTLIDLLGSVVQGIFSNLVGGSGSDSTDGVTEIHWKDGSPYAYNNLVGLNSTGIHLKPALSTVLDWCRGNTSMCGELDAVDDYWECRNCSDLFPTICKMVADGNECDVSPCLNGATCVDQYYSVVCLCAPGFTGSNCETNIDECVSNPCRPKFDASCIDGINGYTCRCQGERTGANCDIVVCPTGWHYLAATGLCYYISKDSVYPISTTGAQNYCSWVGGTFCSDTSTLAITVQWFLQNITLNPSVGWYNVSTWNSEPGFDSNTCADNATGPSGYTACSWPLNAACTLIADPNQCISTSCAYIDTLGVPTQATCTDGYQSYSCQCPSTRTGLNCETVACDTNWNSYSNYCYTTNQPADTWVNANKSCLQKKSNLTSIATIGEQTFLTKLMRSLNIVSAWIGLVFNSSGQNSFTPPYWIDNTNYALNNLVGTAETNDALDLTTKTNDCYRANAFYVEMSANTGHWICTTSDVTLPAICRMSSDLNECHSNPCMNNGTCYDDYFMYHCLCNPGYTGYNCSSEINFCESKPCLNNSTCTHSLMLYRCNCSSQFTGQNCETSLLTCSSNPCQNGATCTELTLGYQCLCVPGFTGSRCETNLRAVVDQHSSPSLPKWTSMDDHHCMFPGSHPVDPFGYPS